MSTRGTIVVGVDGSKGSRTALEFALEEAARRGAAVRVLSVVPEPTFWATTYGMSPEMLDDLSAEFERTTWNTVDAVIREHGGALADVPVEVRAPEGSPARALVSLSRDADLLVIGHRGRGAAGSALLGSVGLHGVLHASIPVTVVHSAPHTAAPVDDPNAALAGA